MNARWITGPRSLLPAACVGLGAVLAGAEPAAAAGDAASSASAPGVAASPAAGVLTEADETGTVEQPRSFGYMLGDVLRQRVLLLRAGHDLAPTALPVADRVGLYLERRVPRLEHDEQGRRWLAIEYQVINAPRTLTALSLPALSIATAAGTLAVPAWPISVGPLTPQDTFNRGGLQPLRPDRRVEPLPTFGIERRLKASLVVLAVVLAAWVAWWAWRNALEALRLPFARAWQQVRRLDPAGEAAWVAVHHALNETAGRTVHGRTLPRLLAEAPHLRPLGPQLEAFFRLSEQRFFATAIGAAPAPFALRELSLALRQAERAAHR